MIKEKCFILMTRWHRSTPVRSKYGRTQTITTRATHFLDKYGGGL